MSEQASADRDAAKEFCAKMDRWALLMGRDGAARGGSAGFREAWRTVRLAISKSCLLSRTMYLGLEPSEVPCPVHAGKWSGLHGGWPDNKYADGRPAPESEQCRAWHDAGCRCYLHGCGCTTGWQAAGYDATGVRLPR